MAIINLTNAAANAAIMSVINDIDADGTEGTLKVYTTPMPASPDAAATGTLLSEHTLTYPCLVKQTLTGTPSWAGGSATFTDTGHSSEWNINFMILGRHKLEIMCYDTIGNIAHITKNITIYNLFGN